MLRRYATHGNVRVAVVVLWACAAALVVAGGRWNEARAAAPATLDQLPPPQGSSDIESKERTPRILGPLILDDTQPLVPRQSRTEPQHDHMEAIALFSAGRMHERREEYADALRCYQRALRHDPCSTAIAQAIVPVAVRLKRYPEAIRYTLKVVELEDADPLLLRRLGAFLTEEGDWARAVNLYERALAAGSEGSETASDVLLRMEMGRLYHLTEDYKKAADCFASVLHAIDHPDESALNEQLTKVLLGRPGPTYQLMGECFLAADRPHEALAVFQKADQLASAPAMRQFNLARVYAKTDRLADAMTALETCLAEYLADQGMVPYETLADVLAKLGREGELLERLEKLHAAKPDNASLGYYLAAQYQAAGMDDKAETLYLELLTKTPTLTGYRNLVEMYRQARRFDALLAILGEAVEKTSVLELLGAESQTISGDAELMRGLVEAARDKSKSTPNDLGYGMRLAVALLAMEAEEYETAGEFFELALAARPAQAAEVLMVWGVGLLMGDRAAEAVAVFQRAIDEQALPDDNPAFHFYLAGALAMADRIDEALAAAQMAAEKQPDSARFRGRRPWVLYIGERHGEAMKAYLELIEEFDADHTSTETREVLREARLALSNLCVIKGHMAQAEEWLERVLDEFPDDTGALNDLGYLWADQDKNLHRAERMIQKAVDAEPDNLAYRDSLGWVLFRLGESSRAIDELEKAAAGPQPDAVILDHLGDAYRQATRPDKAAETWRKAAELFRQEKEIDKARSVERKLQQE